MAPTIFQTPNHSFYPWWVDVSGRCWVPEIRFGAQMTIAFRASTLESWKNLSISQLNLPSSDSNGWLIGAQHWTRFLPHFPIFSTRGQRVTVTPSAEVLRWRLAQCLDRVPNGEASVHGSPRLHRGPVLPALRPLLGLTVPKSTRSHPAAARGRWPGLQDGGVPEVLWGSMAWEVECLTRTCVPRVLPIHDESLDVSRGRLKQRHSDHFGRSILTRDWAKGAGRWGHCLACEGTSSRKQS